MQPGSLDFELVVREPWQAFEQHGVQLCSGGFLLEVHWEGEGMSPVKRQLEGPEVTVTYLKQGESLWKRKTPGATQPIEVKDAEQTCSCDWAPMR